MLLRQLDAAAVHADVVARRVGLRAELANRRAVHGHASLEHQLLGRAPRRDAGLREDLLQPFHHHSVPRRHENTKKRKSVLDWRIASGCGK